MGWAVGYDIKWQRDVGYGVPSICDQPECDARIDRGLGYVCGNDPFGGEHGCGLYFCDQHLSYRFDDPDDPEIDFGRAVPLCERCLDGGQSFDPKPDLDEWLQWKLSDESWQQWRDENPAEVEKIRRLT